MENSGSETGQNYGATRPSWVDSARQSRTVLLAVVIYTNFLDYLLLTAVVPIIPDFLVESDSKSVEEVLEANNDTLFVVNNTNILIVHNQTTIDVNGTAEVTFIERILHFPVRAITENAKVGWLLSTKALVQMVVNPIIGLLSGRLSNRTLLIFGTCVFLVSSTMFAAAESYIPLLLARAAQGVGSAATTIAGMSMIAEHYTDDDGRSRAMGFGMGGMAAGILVGYPFGGLIYAVSGKSAPFVGIALLCMLNIGLQCELLDKRTSFSLPVTPASFHRLLKDPHILICAGAIMVTSMSLAVLESTVPIWVMDNMAAKQWQIGLIFIPDSLGYILGTIVFPVIAKRYGRWLFSFGSLLLIGIGTAVIPFCTELNQLLVPHLSLGIGVGVTDAAIMPLLALLVDQRHVTSYGSVYAIVQLAVCLAYSLGPSIAGQIVKSLGFKWCMWGIAILNVMCAPLSLFLRSVSVAEDKQCILPAGHNMDEDEGNIGPYQSMNSLNGHTVK